MRALLTPLEHKHPDGWRATVNRTLKDLFGADIATFQLPAPGIDFLYSEEFDWAYLRRYVPTLDAYDSGTLDRMAELEVCNRRMLWGEELPDYFRSTYYNELVVPMRGFDMLSATTRLDGKKEPATLYLHHGNRHGPRFGERGVALLQIVYPAFRAGVRTFHRFHARRNGLFRMLDAIDDCVWVFDPDGKSLHRNAGYRKLRLREDEEQALVARASRLVRSLSALWSARRSRALETATGVGQTVWIGSRRFSLEGSLVEGAAIGPRPCLLVIVREERLVAVPGSPGTVAPPIVSGVPANIAAERFGLTPREAEVATLLVRRLTNKEVAQRLGISVHTVRHHVERVLAKLGIHSRREVAGKLTGSEKGRE